VSPKARLDLVGVAEVAKMLGITRQRVDQIVRAHPDFPEPVAELAAGRVWMKKDVRAWAHRTGRKISP
jgi:predicted DNA-binding transcriptional regulator AlpA